MRRRLLRKCYTIKESINNKKTAKSGRVVINSTVLKNYVGRKVKIFIYLVGGLK